MAQICYVSVAACIAAQVSRAAACSGLLSALNRYASLFLHAVKDDEAAGYSEVVFR